MATAFDQPRQYTPYQEQYNKELILKALTYKQGKYDVNRAKIQQTISSLTSLDLAKEEDANYLYNKVQGLTQTINKYGMGDLSLDSRTDYLRGQISSLADENVLNAFQGTKMVRNIQKGADEAWKNGTYSDDNYAFSMKDAIKWLNDGQVGSKYTGNSKFVPFTDYHPLFMDAIKSLEGEVYSILNPTTNQFEYYKENGKKLSAARIRDALDLVVSSNPNVAQQLQVNAWAQFQDMDETQLDAILKSELDDVSEINDQELEHNTHESKKLN